MYRQYKKQYSAHQKADYGTAHHAQGHTSFWTHYSGTAVYATGDIGKMGRQL